MAGVLRVLLIVPALLLTGVVWAHPEIEQALARLNAQIATAPANAELYLDRGDLYARHDDWVMAEANYLRAAELTPKHARLDRALGTVALAMGNAAEALRHFNAALARNAGDAETRVLRARAHAALGARAPALADYTAALARIENAPPELYLERADVCASPDDAIRGLDEGIARLGPVVTLQMRALALEESLGRIDAALARLNTLAAQSERKESWLKRRGDVLARAGRERDARAAYAAALAAIDALPDWLRQAPDTVRLAGELRHLAAPRS